MKNGKLIALSVIVLLLEGIGPTQSLSAKQQSDDIGVIMPIEAVSVEESEQQFEELFNSWDSLAGPSGEKSSALDKLLSCHSAPDMSSPPPDSNWAVLLVGSGPAVGSSFHIETKSIKNCASISEKSVLYWGKYLFNDGSYAIHRFTFNCMKREGEFSDRSWFYSVGGNVVEASPQDGIKNPLPISPGFRLMKYICDDYRDVSVLQVPEVYLEWEDVEFWGGDVRLSILANDVTYKYSSSLTGRGEVGGIRSPQRPEVTFWVRRDYSGAKWTKYRYAYSRDTINCEDSTYFMGRAFAFLPNKELNGTEVNLRSMHYIAPNSNEDAIMKQVCNF